MATAGSNGSRVTVGELGRNIDDLKAAVREGFREVHAKIDGLTFVHQDVYAAEQARTIDRIRGAETRLGQIEARNQWLTRAFLGGMLTAVAGFVGNLAYLVVHVH